MTMPLTSTPTSNIEHRSAHSALLWLTRSGAGRAFDAWRQSNPTFTPASTAALPKATSYAHILGLEDPHLANGANNPKFVSGQDNLNRLKPGTAWQHMTGNNVNGGKFSATRYAKETLWHNNIQGLTDYKNNPGTAISKGLGLGILGFHVAGQTNDGYQAAKAKYGDNSLAVGASTVGTFGVSAAKAGITWEVSNILYDIGRTVLPKMTFGKVPVAGIVMGAVGAAFAANSLDKLIPPPQNPKKAAEDSSAVYQSMRQTLQPGNPFQVQQASQGDYGLAG